jgi:hypothetical protein
MRNLPNDYTRDMVLELMDSCGFAGRYDFFYLPMDFQTNCGLGYAFVNFTMHADAQQAQLVLQGFSDWRIPSHKILDVSWSELSQGIEANIERYRNSSVFHSSVSEEFQPLLFAQGSRIPFPEPTRHIRQPRLKTLMNRTSGDDDALAIVVNQPNALSPSERINRTISIINSGDITEIICNARKTLSSKLAFVVPEVMSEINSVGQVCSFHRRLHDAIPDLSLSLDNISVDDNGAVCWRATCTGTQVKRFIPNLPIDARASFALEVTVKHSSNGMPMFISWNFGVADGDSKTLPEISLDDMDADLTLQELLHRKGDCQPCAYFAFRADGCRNTDCEFCHLCTKSQAKAKKKAKAAQMKASMDADSRVLA